jgi:hypothetical protein
LSESGDHNCRKEPWQRTTQFEPDKTIQKWLRSQARKPVDENVEGLLSEKSRGDWTPLELFLGGIRALTLQLSIGDIEAAFGKQP